MKKIHNIRWKLEELTDNSNSKRGTRRMYSKKWDFLYEIFYYGLWGDMLDDLHQQIAALS